MIVVLWPLLVTVAGLVLYFASKEAGNGPRFREVGRIMFFVGLLVVLWRLGAEAVRL